VIAGAHAEVRQHGEHCAGAKPRAARGRGGVPSGTVSRSREQSGWGSGGAARGREADLVEDGVGVAALRHHAVDAARDAHVVRVGAEGGQQHLGSCPWQTARRARVTPHILASGRAPGAHGAHRRPGGEPAEWHTCRYYPEQHSLPSTRRHNASCTEQKTKDLHTLEIESRSLMAGTQAWYEV